LISTVIYLDKFVALGKIGCEAASRYVERRAREHTSVAGD